MILLKFNKLDKKYSKGFSLIELSAVVSIAATVAVGYLSWTKPELKTASENSINTYDKLKKISQSIENFRVKYNRLPCPADPTIRKDNTLSTNGSNDYQNNFGSEDLDTLDQEINGVTTLGIDCPQNIGVVPVNSLEIEDDYIFDSWGNYITYHVSDSLCGSDAGIGSVSNSESILKGCTSIDYSEKSGNIIVNNTVEDITKNVAYILISHGVNGYGSYMQSGAQKPYQEASDEELENIRVINRDDATTGFEEIHGTVKNINKYIQKDIGTDFDDLILFKTRIQIEKLTTRKNHQLLSYDECEKNSETLGNLEFNDMSQLKDNIDSSKLGSNIDGEQIGLGLFMSIQRACIEYSNYQSSGAINSWKIDNKSWSPRCPGTSLFVVNDTSIGTGSCQCDSGDWNSC